MGAGRLGGKRTNLWGTSVEPCWRVVAEFGFFNQLRQSFCLQR